MIQIQFKKSNGMLYKKHTYAYIDSKNDKIYFITWIDFYNNIIFNRNIYKKYINNF